MENEKLQEQEFRYCLVGNIVQESYDENHEIRKGTKAFRPGTKVCISTSFCGDGGENRYVIGMSRHKKYIKIITVIKHIENFRFQKIYKPAILKLMADNSKGCDSWYKNTDEEKKYIEDEAKLLNSKDNPYLKKEKVDFGTYYSDGIEIIENNKTYVNNDEYRTYNIYDSNDKENPVTTARYRIDNNIYTYVSVYYEDGTINKPYSYLPGEYDVKVGDRVLVERNDEYVTGIVTAINYYKRNDAPCSPNILKEIEEILSSDYDAEPVTKDYFVSEKELNFFNKWDIKPFDVLKHRTFNKEEIAKSNKCGCYYCERIYNALEIVDWLERDAKQTAICPYCGETFVLGDASGYPIYDFDFIEDMNNYFF